MSNALVPSFGRRRPEPTPNPAGPIVRTAPEAAAPPAPVARPAASAGAPLAELRALCLARIDPATVATMAPDRLAAEVERLLAEVATEQRIQLNAREQRQLALDLVDDMLGLGPLEPLLDDETITDIMVNAASGSSSNSAARGC